MKDDQRAYIDDQAAVMFTEPQAMDTSMHAGWFALRACCRPGGEDFDALSQAMARPRRGRRVA